MNNKNNDLSFDNKSNSILNARMILVLFKILYKKEEITKKEYNALVLKINRTFNLNE